MSRFVRARYVLIATASLLGAALACRAAGEPETRVVQSVSPRKGFRVTHRLLFVVDVSGSMTGEGERSISAVRRVLEGPTDELQAGAIAFAGRPSRWRGVPEPCQHDPGDPHGRRCVLPGWAAFPGRSKELLGWLRGKEPDGATNVDAALRAALLDRCEELTVVLVSDGIFDGDAALRALEAGQATRKARGQPHAGLMVWRAGESCAGADTLARLARAGGGGLWHEEAQEEAPPAPLLEQD